MADVEAKVLKCKDYLLADLDDSKLLYVLKKLSQLNITIDILQSTGIGKIVNTLRKRDGTIAERAREIIHKWKDMVSAEAAKLQEEQNSGSESEANYSANEIAENEAGQSSNEINTYDSEVEHSSNEREAYDSEVEHSSNEREAYDSEVEVAASRGHRSRYTNHCDNTADVSDVENSEGSSIGSDGGYKHNQSSASISKHCERKTDNANHMAEVDTSKDKKHSKSTQKHLSNNEDRHYKSERHKHKRSEHSPKQAKDLSGESKSREPKSLSEPGNMLNQHKENLSNGDKHSHSKSSSKKSDRHNDQKHNHSSKEMHVIEHNSDRLDSGQNSEDKHNIYKEKDTDLISSKRINKHSASGKDHHKHDSNEDLHHRSSDNKGSTPKSGYTKGEKLVSNDSHKMGDKSGKHLDGFGKTERTDINARYPTHGGSTQKQCTSYHKSDRHRENDSHDKYKERKSEEQHIHKYQQDKKSLDGNKNVHRHSDKAHHRITHDNVIRKRGHTSEEKPEHRHSSHSKSEQAEKSNVFTTYEGEKKGHIENERKRLRSSSSELSEYSHHSQSASRESSRSRSCSVESVESFHSLKMYQSVTDDSSYASSEASNGDSSNSEVYTKQSHSSSGKHRHLDRTHTQNIHKHKPDNDKKDESHDKKSESKDGKHGHRVKEKLKEHGNEKHDRGTKHRDKDLKKRDSNIDKSHSKTEETSKHGKHGHRKENHIVSDDSEVEFEAHSKSEKSQEYSFKDSKKSSKHNESQTSHVQGKEKYRVQDTSGQSNHKSDSSKDSKRKMNEKHNSKDDLHVKTRTGDDKKQSHEVAYKGSRDKLIDNSKHNSSSCDSDSTERSPRSHSKHVEKISAETTISRHEHRHSSKMHSSEGKCETNSKSSIGGYMHKDYGKKNEPCSKNEKKSKRSEDNKSRSDRNETELQSKCQKSSKYSDGKGSMSDRKETEARSKNEKVSKHQDNSRSRSNNNEMDPISSNEKSSKDLKNRSRSSSSIEIRNKEEPIYSSHKTSNETNKRQSTSSSIDHRSKTKSSSQHNKSSGHSTEHTCDKESKHVIESDDETETIYAKHERSHCHKEERIVKACDDEEENKSSKHKSLGNTLFNSKHSNSSHRDKEMESRLRNNESSHINENSESNSNNNSSHRDKERVSSSRNDKSSHRDKERETNSNNNSSHRDKERESSSRNDKSSHRDKERETISNNNSCHRDKESASSSRNDKSSHRDKERESRSRSDKSSHTDKESVSNSNNNSSHRAKERESSSRNDKNSHIDKERESSSRNDKRSHTDNDGKSHSHRDKEKEASSRNNKSLHHVSKEQRSNDHIIKHADESVPSTKYSSGSELEENLQEDIHDNISVKESNSSKGTNYFKNNTCVQDADVYKAGKHTRKVAEFVDSDIDIHLDKVHKSSEKSRSKDKSHKCSHRDRTEKDEKHSKHHKSSHRDNDEKLIKKTERDKRVITKHNSLGSESKYEDGKKDKHKSICSSKKHKHKDKDKKSHPRSNKRPKTEPTQFEDMICFDNSDAVVTENAKSPKKIINKEAEEKKARYEEIRSKFKIKKNYESKTAGLGGKIEGLKRKAVDEQEAPAGKRQMSSDIASYLPSTQAHYRPWRYNEVADKPACTLENDPSPFIVSRNKRTAVYSGRKQTMVAEMHSLFDLCMKILQDNIDYIDYVGGIPLCILKPVLEKCTPKQLYDLEDYNPHFLEDSDYLWKLHCEKEFKGCEPDEMEAWRELYLRSMDEREVKLKNIKASITKSIAKAIPARQTKLAYVDNVAKPPREVRRQQARFGTSNVIVTKKHHFPGVDMISIGRAKQQMTERAKKAPMMQRALAILKNPSKR